MNRVITFIKQGYHTAFQITMKNYSVNMETGLQTSSVLRSVFHREIYEIPTENVGYTRYTLRSTEYQNAGNEPFKTWTFAKDAVFYSCLFCLQDRAVKEAYYKQAEENPPIPSLTESFQKYPKLPSVYLLVMQAIDIITLDAFLCMANSELLDDSLTTAYTKINEMAKRNIPIGTGIYSNSSYYFNDELYLRMLGVTTYQNEPCWVLEYRSEPSDIYVENQQVNIARKSKSLYTGKILISQNNGDILYGELDEDVVAMGNSKKYSKRFIVMERVSL